MRRCSTPWLCALAPWLPVSLIAPLEAGAQEVRTARQGAPIVYANRGGGAGRGAPPAAAPSTQPRVSYRYADEPGVEYVAGAPTAAPHGPALDLRRSAPREPSPAAWVSALEEDQARAPEPPAAAGPARPAWLERERVGAPYEALGRTYVPTPEPGYAQTGAASWYGADFHGKPTASGEIFDQDGLSAAHPTLPIPSLVQVTNLANNREVILRVNDRGPFVGERLIDVSRKAADVLGFTEAGRARVHVRYLGPAPRRVSGDAGNAAPAAPLPAAPPPRPESPPPSPPPRPLADGFVVQVGAFSELANAERARAAVRSVGVVALEPRTVGGAALYRVRLGPWASAAAAEEARAQVATLGFPGARVSASR